MQRRQQGLETLGRQLMEPRHYHKSNSKVLPRWNVEALVQAEGAIATFCATRKRSTLTLDEFDQLMKPLQTEAQPTINGYSTLSALGSAQEQLERSNQAGNDENQLSRPQALLLDLLTCASPTLYDLVSKENAKVYIQVVDFQGNRMQKLRSLASVHQVSVQKRNSIQTQISLSQNQIKYPKKDSKLSAAPKRPKLSVMETIFPQYQSTTSQKSQERSTTTTTTTTLHERVTLRAKAKQDLKQEISDRMALGNPDFRLKLADALWSHSRHILVRQSRLQALTPLRTNKNNNTSITTSTTRPCVMTMKDIVDLFPDSSRRQVVQAMLELHDLAPQWIVL